MTHSLTTSTQTYLAIDVAKASHDVVIKHPDGRERLLKIPNTLDGYERLMEAAGSSASHIIAAFEPTADYHRNIAYWLARQGVSCQLASSLACARIRETLYKSWDKNDRKDAKVILYLVEHGLCKPFFDPLLNGTLDIQEISNTYHQIVAARTRCQHSLVNHFLALYFPEMERYLNSTRAEWFCRFMLHFPTPSSITSLRKTTFVKKASTLVGRKVAKQQFLEELYETAERSIGLPIDTSGAAVDAFKLQLSRYQDLTQQRTELESRADKLLANRDDYQRLKSLPGVGPVIALMILAESGDLRRFAHYRQYLSYCGFDLAAVQSGSQKGQCHLSKRGNARLRYAYWLAATVAIRQTQNSFRAKFERYVRKDPDNADLRRKARVAIATKMARVAHALVKNNCDYRGYYEFGYET